MWFDPSTCLIGFPIQMSKWIFFSFSFFFGYDTCVHLPIWRRLLFSEQITQAYPRFTLEFQTLVHVSLRKFTIDRLRKVPKSILFFSMNVSWIIWSSFFYRGDSHHLRWNGISCETLRNLVYVMIFNSSKKYFCT